MSPHPPLRTRPLRCLAGALVLATLALGCGGSSGPPAGAEGGHCAPNGTCKPGLSCLSNLCVRPVSGAGGEAGAAGATGGSSGTAGMTTGSAGASGSAGAAGTTGGGGGASAAGGLGGGGASGASGAGGSGPVADGGTDASPDGDEDALAPSDVALIKRATCPAGPFATPVAGSPMAVCTDAASRAALRYDSTAGPVWVATQGAFYFSSFPANSLSITGYPAAGTTTGDIVKYTPGGGCGIVVGDVGTLGLTVASDGRLIAASYKTSSVSEIDLGNGLVTVLAGASTGVKIGVPIDVAVHSNGTLYFSNMQAGAGTLSSGVSSRPSDRRSVGRILRTHLRARNRSARTFRRPSDARRVRRRTHHPERRRPVFERGQRSSRSTARTVARPSTAPTIST